MSAVVGNCGTVAIGVVFPVGAEFIQLIVSALREEFLGKAVSAGASTEDVRTGRG